MLKSIVWSVVLFVGLSASVMAAPLKLTNCRVDSVSGTTVNFGSLKVSQCEDMLGRDSWTLEITRKNEEGLSGVRELVTEAMVHGLRVDIDGDRKSTGGSVDSVTVRANPLLQ